MTQHDHQWRLSWQLERASRGGSIWTNQIAARANLTPPTKGGARRMEASARP